MARTHRLQPADITPAHHGATSASPLGLTRPRRLTLAELLRDPDASSRLTKEVAWAERLRPMGDEPA